MMKNSLEFPLNFIQKNKTAAFWSIQFFLKESLKDFTSMNEEDKTLFFELSKQSIELFDFPHSWGSENIETDLTDQVDWVMKIYQDQLVKAQYKIDESVESEESEEEDYAELILMNLPNEKKIVSEEISKIIKKHSVPGFAMNNSENYSESLLEILGIIISICQLEEKPLETVKMILDDFSDEYLINSIKEKNDTEQYEKQMGIRQHSLFDHVKKAFPKEKKHFHFTLAGYIASSMGFLDSEEQHNDSHRKSSFRAYLRNVIKSTIHRMSS